MSTHSKLIMSLSMRKIRNLDLREVAMEEAAEVVAEVVEPTKTTEVEEAAVEVVVVIETMPEEAEEAAEEIMITKKKKVNGKTASDKK